MLLAYTSDVPETEDVAVKKILLVEDDSFLGGVVVERFRKEGLACELAIDGEAGLELARSYKPDLILLDLLLPGIDGYEVLSRLKSDPELKNIHVVVFSNLGQAEEKARALQLGADEFAVKAEMDLDDIIRLVKKYI